MFKLNYVSQDGSRKSAIFKIKNTTLEALNTTPAFYDVFMQKVNAIYLIGFEEVKA